MTYDAAGNLLQDGFGAGYHSYTWDAENRMTTASLNGTVQATYTYNALGQRVERNGPGVPWGGHVVDEWYDPFGNMVGTWLGSLIEDYFPPVAGRRYGEYSSGFMTYYHTDQLGSTGVAMDQAGNWEGTNIYDPWGQIVTQGGTNASPQFAGMPKRRDYESGLDNTLNRMYTSSYGRWLTPDPAGSKAVNLVDPQSWNKYAYARNNPNTLTDPTGLYVCGASMTGQQCTNFQNTLDKAQTAADALADKYGVNSVQYEEAQRAINAYGEAGVDNGVTIAVGKIRAAGAKTDVSPETGAKTDDNPTGQKITVTFRAANLGDSGIAAHEGVHVADGSAYVASGFSRKMNPFGLCHRIQGVSGPRRKL